MADITNLASTLGLATAQRPDTSKPFTRAAQQELQITVAERNAEKKLAAERAKTAKEFNRMIKTPLGVLPKYAKRIGEIASTAMATPNLNENEIYVFNDAIAQQKQASEIWKRDMDDVQANKYALPKSVREAILSNDDAKIKAEAIANPDYFEYHPDTDTHFLKQRIPKIDQVKESQGWFGADDFAPKGLPKGNIQPTEVSQEKQIKILHDIQKDPNRRANILLDNEDAVAEIMKAQKLDKMAAEDLFIANTVHTFAQGTKPYSPKTPSNWNRNYTAKFENINGGGLFSNGIRIQPSTTDPTVNVVDKPNEKGKETEVLKATVFEGKDVKPFDKVEDYIRIGKDSYILRGIYNNARTTARGLTAQEINRATGIGEDALAEAKIFDVAAEEAARQKYLAALRFKGQPANYATVFNTDDIGKPTFSSGSEEKRLKLLGRVPTTNTAAPSSNTSKAKVVKKDSIKSKVGTKGFEGYSEKELVDYYKSQGYTVE